MRDCGAETQISGSGTSSRHPKFLAPAQASKFAVPDPERYGPKLKTKNHCIICTIGLLYKICLLNGNSNFRLCLLNGNSNFRLCLLNRNSNFRLRRNSNFRLRTGIQISDYNWLAVQNLSVEWDLKFQAPAPTFKSF